MHSGYEGLQRMNLGKQIRLRRIWRHERAVIIPYDHGVYSGPQHGINDPRALTERIAHTGADAVLVTPGTLQNIAPALGELGVVLRLDGGFTKYVSSSADYRTICPVPHAVRLGADAGIVFTFIGTPQEGQSLERLGITSTEAETWGLPLVAETLAPGILNNHFGSTVFGSRGKKDDIFEETLNVCRIAAETGADIIKTRYTGDVEQFREVVRTCGARIIIAGGPKTDGSDERLLQLTYDCMKAGAAGIIFGRNVWQHRRMEKLIGAMCAIVHGDETVTQALKLLR